MLFLSYMNKVTPFANENWANDNNNILRNALFCLKSIFFACGNCAKTYLSSDSKG